MKKTKVTIENGYATFERDGKTVRKKFSTKEEKDKFTAVVLTAIKRKT